jgi:hypothetical protein
MMGLYAGSFMRAHYEHGTHIGLTSLSSKSGRGKGSRGGRRMCAHRQFAAVERVATQHELVGAHARHTARDRVSVRTRTPTLLACAHLHTSAHITRHTLSHLRLLSAGATSAVMRACGRRG